MPVINDLKAELNELTTFKFIATAFTEASAVKLRKIRGMFEINRQFYDEISHIYHLVQVNAARQNLKILPILVSKPKVLSVAITSNLRFYGMLNIDIIKHFINDSEKDGSDKLVIGSTGIEYIKSIKFKNKYEIMSFKKDDPNGQEATQFLEKVKSYDKVMVYYPKFVSLLFQSVGVTDITQSNIMDRKDPDETVHIIFEPELSKIMAFFQSQIRLLLFLRIMLEAELARTAARLLTMSAAEEKTDEMIKHNKTILSKTISSFLNTQLLETFAGIRKWKQ